MMDIINKPLGWLMWLIYTIVRNYGVALIIFTIVMRLILLPLNFKQQKSMAQTQLIKPKMDALQKQYGDDKEKLNEETMKLYKKHGVNPLSGCLPLLIQFPILFALYNVIRKPLTYIYSLSADNINGFITQFSIPANDQNAQIKVAKCLFDIGDKFGINFNFLGLDLSQTPTFNLNAPMFGITPIIVIPIVAALTTYLSSKFMNIGMPKEPKKDDDKPKRPPKPGEKDADAAQSTAKTMTTIMPLMTLWFTFMMPSGISVYWIAGNVIQIGQQYIINRHYVPKIKERMAIENEELESNRKKRKNGRRSR